MKNKKKYKIAFLDRDGVLNKNLNGGYVGFKKNLKWIDGARKTIKLLKEEKYKVIVITNQSGIARDFFKKKDVLILHRYMLKKLKEIGTKIDKFLICPHHIDGKIFRYKIKCQCRKPGIENFKKVQKIWNVDKKRSFMIGDQKTDMQFAKKSGIKGFFFKEKNLYKFVKEKVLK